MEGRTICDGAIDDDLRYACDAMVLGSLMKSSRKMGIWPKPESPFNGKKFKDLALAVRRIKVLDVCNKTRSRRLTSLNLPSNCHGLEDSIEASMKSLEAGLDGLELSNYSRKRQVFCLSRWKFTDEKSEDYLTGLQKLILSPPEGNFVSKLADETRNASPTCVSEASSECSTEDKKNTPPEEARSPPNTATKTFERPILTKPNSRDFQSVQTRLRTGFSKTEEAIKPHVNSHPNSSSKENSRLNKGSAISSDEYYKEDVTSIAGRQVKQTARAEPQVLTERKLNRTTSFPSLLGDDTKSPVKEVQAVPIVTSIEEITEDVPSLTEENIKRLEVREILNENLTTADEEEVFAPPHNFKIRMSKNANKRFSNRF
jgi:hypothetical protein